MTTRVECLTTRLRFIYTLRARALLRTYRLLALLGVPLCPEGCARALVAQCRIEVR